MFGRVQNCWEGGMLLRRSGYTDLEADFMHRLQGTAEECLWMARAFLLLFLLGAYLFTNGGQTVSLRWLAIFQDFERAWAGGQYAWLTFNPLWTLLVKGHCTNW